jgi:RimJ/RimL family protein N-acetyltransferase
MEYLIYKFDRNWVLESHKLDLVSEIWKPSLKKVYHKRMPKKYIIWWFFHYLGIFKNKQLQIRLFFENNHLAHFFCIVPKYYRWPFMRDNDVQITYVITENFFQGKGLAYKCISNTLNEIESKSDIWYVTDSKNIPSQRLAEKMGFVFMGVGKKKSYLIGLIKILILKE